MNRMSGIVIVCAALLGGWCAAAVGNIVLETVPVGNPGNAGELSGAGAGGTGADRICGRVDYIYQMGKFEVTAAQYTAFLNAVAATDTYSLYVTDMWTSPYATKIERLGSPGSYTYQVASDYANRPAAWIHWGRAARFANWLENGQPVGAQDLTTTEDGSYYLNGANTNTALNAVTRKSTAHYVIPTEDEWYKAAHHCNDGVTGNYWDYAMGSDAVPSNVLSDPDPGNSANYIPTGGQYTIGAPYWRTEVGAFTNSASPYGTFDMDGNVFEWTEQMVTSTRRQLRGGTFDSPASSLFAGYRSGLSPMNTTSAVGLRIAYIPEPATLFLLALGAVVTLRRRRVWP